MREYNELRADIHYIITHIQPLQKHASSEQQGYSEMYWIQLVDEKSQWPTEHKPISCAVQNNNNDDDNDNYNNSN